jgi:hypothetical protein
VLGLALSTTLSDPARMPLPVGVNVTLIVQVLSTRSLEPHVLLGTAGKLACSKAVASYRSPKGG